MGVKQANPEVTFERVQFAEEGANGCSVRGKRFDGGVEFIRGSDGAAMVRAQIEAIIGRILRDEAMTTVVVGKPVGLAAEP